MNLTAPRRSLPLIAVTLSLQALVLGATAHAQRIHTGASGGLSAVRVTPTPGTTLVAGHAVTFTVTVKYRLDAADSGSIVLMPQDANGSSLVLGRQVSKTVTKGAGEITLSDSITVPAGIRQVQLFVVLFPNGATRVAGQLFMQFPVRAPN